MLATSSTVANRCRSELGRAVVKSSRSIVAKSTPRASASASCAVFVIPYWIISEGIWTADSLEMNRIRPQSARRIPSR